MGKSDLTLGNEPLRFRNVSEDVLACKNPPGGLEEAKCSVRGINLPCKQRFSGVTLGGAGHIPAEIFFIFFYFFQEKFIDFQEEECDILTKT